jgi:hypothetical protein
MLIRNVVSEMTNLLTKPLARAWSRQGDQVVSDRGKSPVCLGALPGAHKHMVEGQMLFDVLVEDLDSKTLAVELDHLKFGHVQIVGDQKSHFFGPAFGNKEKHSSHLGQPDEFLCDLEFSFLGKLDGFVSPRSLGQVTDDDFLAADFQDTIALERRNESPACFYNRIEDRGAGVPTVDKDRYRSAELILKTRENVDCQLDFALESSLGTKAFGLITANRPSQTLSCAFQNASHGALAFDQPGGRMMDADSLNLLAFPSAGRIVDDRQNFLAPVGRRSDQSLIGFFEALPFLGRAIEKALKIVGQPLGKLSGDFAGRMKLDQPDETDEVEKEMFDLGFAQNVQETAEHSRNLFREKFSHGFRVLLGLVSIGDFDRKPFCFQ